MVQKGEEVIIIKVDKPFTKLVPITPDNRPRDMSNRIWEGDVWIADDFNELSDEVIALFQDSVE